MVNIGCVVYWSWQIYIEVVFKKKVFVWHIQKIGRTISIIFKEVHEGNFSWKYLLQIVIGYIFHKI